MAENLLATRKGPTSGYTGPESRRSGRASEIFEITATSNAAAGDTTPAFRTAMKRPQQVVGAYNYTITGNSIVLEAMFAQTTAQKLSVEIIGLPA
jgi:hypothetical protein